MEDREYFERQIKGLILILERPNSEKGFIHREYVIEKLNMILFHGIGFDYLIKEKLE